MMNLKELGTWFNPTQKELQNTLPSMLLEKGYRVHACENGIIAISPFGKVPTLVAHLDTINTHRADAEVVDAYYNFELNLDGFVTLTTGAQKAGVKCLGADDRAGVYTVMESLNLLESEHLPHVIFTTNEEIGCVGSGDMCGDTCGGCQSYLQTIDTNLLIQVDRGRHDGSWQEAVYYSYDTDASRLENDILDSGFVTAQGSYTDIGELAPYLNVPAVNISASYEYEHTPNERLHWHMFQQNFENLMYFLSKHWYDEYGVYVDEKSWINVPSHQGSESWYDVASTSLLTGYTMEQAVSDKVELGYASTLGDVELETYLIDMFGNNTDYRERFLDNMYTYLGGY